ncbi:hypothetical protein [Mucilaginibacter sp.]|uniref:hypothetical protein n=1 Tax=Mucilaginibacter sp. TaxID=1882438 RepID=UPI0035BC0285
MYVTVAMLAGVLFVLYLYSQLRRAVNINVENQAQTFFGHNDHYMAFELWDTYSKQLVSTYKKDTITQLLNDTLFYDVSGGDNLISLNDHQWAVHNRNSSISIWTADKTFEHLVQTPLSSALNLEVSDTKKYMAYRNAATGEIEVYNIKTGTAKNINNSRYENFTQRKAKQNRERSNNPVDYKMGFIKETDLISYVDAKGFTFIYDPEHQIAIGVSVLAQVKYNSQDIPDIYQFSKGMKYLAIKNDSVTLFKWQIGTPLKKIREIHNLRYFYHSALPDTLVYLSDNQNLVIEPYVLDTRESSYRPFSKLKDALISPDGTKALIQTNNDKLVVYNFRRKSIYNYIDGAKLFADYKNVRRFPAFRSVTRWIDGGNRFTLRKTDGRILLQNLLQSKPLAVCDQNENCNYLSNIDNYRYIITPNAHYSAYVDKKVGCMSLIS